MCIFNHPVIGVDKTSILVALTEDQRQLVVYQNAVMRDRRAGSNAMILPFPYQSGHREVTLLNLEGASNLFDDLRRFFPSVRKTPVVSSNDRETWSDETLSVHHVGGYSVSIAYSIDDIKRIDQEVFTLDPNIERLLSTHYGTNFGFIIALFDSRQGIDEHPIGYIHDLVEPNRCFVPTRHEHGNGDATFDHRIYVVNLNRKLFSKNLVGSVKDKTLNKVFNKYLPPNLIPFKIELSLLQLQGTLDNRDQDLPIIILARK